MKFVNSDLKKFCEEVENKKIVLFGAGQALSCWVGKIFVDNGLENLIAYIIDNGKAATYVTIGNREIPVCCPEILQKEKDVIVVITSQNAAKDMYEQLRDMKLPDTVLVYYIHFIMAVSCGKKDAVLRRQLCDNTREGKINRTIHTFWFSGTPIPDVYKRCMDSWNRYCPDYEVKIWNRDTYDCTQNLFMRQALEHEKWAFVSDYARVDVLYHQGGIYMDMDMEVIRNMDNLLGNEAFFSFDMLNDIGLEIFGTRKGNPLLKTIMDLYNISEFDTDFMVAQPRMIRKCIEDFGVKPDGNMQCIHGMMFVPRSYFQAQDSVIFEYAAMDEDTYAVHRSNTAWQEPGKKEKKRMESKELWKLLQSNNCIAEKEN